MNEADRSIVCELPKSFFETSNKTLIIFQYAYYEILSVTCLDGGNELAVTPDEIRASLKSVDHPQLQLELNSMILLKSGLEPSSR